MSKRPYITILLITEQQLVRADFLDRSLSSPSVHSATFDGNGEWLAGVRQLLAIGPVCGRRLVILSTYVNSHLISFASNSVSQMNVSELENALRFEVETLSGIEIDQIQLASCLADELSANETRYWVNVVRLSEFEGLVRELRGRGVRVFELAHPAGFGAPLGDAPGWLEAWGETLFHFSAATGQIQEFHRRTEEESGPGGPSRISVGWTASPDPAPSTQSPDDGLNLANANALQTWLIRVAQSLMEGRAQLPLIRQARKTSTFDWRPVLASALACLVLIGCVMHRNWLNEKATTLAAETELLVEPGNQKKLDDAENQKLLEQQRELEQESAKISDDLKRVQFFYDYQMGRLPRLLTLLSELRSPELVVQELRPDPKGMVVAGISMNGESAPLLATRLRLLAVPMGWKVSAATQEGQQKMVSGGPWSFQILLEDVGPFDSAPPSESSANASPINRGKF